MMILHRKICPICHKRFKAQRRDKITCSDACRRQMSRLIAKCDSELPVKKYGVIYADPPWRFETFSKKGEKRSPQAQYQTLGLEALKRLPFSRLAAPDCWLFLWVYGPLADEASEIARAWGFEVSSKEGFVWIKTTKKGKRPIGTGYTTRKGAETMLIAKRGRPKRMSAGIRQVQEHPIGVHSEKPDVFRELIEAFAGEVPRIELFARHHRDGWDAWGNQVGYLDQEVAR